MSLTDRLSESISKVRNSLTRKETGGINQMQKDLAGGLGLKSSEFIKDIFNEHRLDPHNEMRQAEKIYRTDPLVVSATQLFTDSIMGRQIDIETEDGEAKAFFNRNIIPKLKKPLREAIENMIKTGNGYIEVMRKGNRPEGVPLNFNEVARSEKMYIDYEKGFKPDSYILEMPKEGDWTAYQINYVEGRKKQIRGIKFETDEIIHLKYGSSHVPVYGRSGLCSAIDSGKILRELERDMAVIARFKSIPRKLLNVKNPDGSGISKEERKRIKQELQNIEDFENILITGKNAETQDFSYQGQFGSMKEGIDYLKKKVTSTLAPGFYIHGEVTNYAVAEEQKNAYYLRVQALRDAIKDPINEILREIAKERGYSQAAKDISITFGEFDFPTRKEKVKEITEKFKAGVMTLNEARDELGLDKEEEIGDAYRFELTKESPLQGAVQQAVQQRQDQEESQEKEA